VTTELAVHVSGLRVLAPGGRCILESTDLEITAREHVLLVGPSGCGKTTLLRAIAGLIVPEQGTIDLFGRRASAPGELLVAPHRRGIGMMFQSGALWPHMSARKTLEFTIASSGGKPTRERVSELLTLVRLGGFEERKPGTLSGGEAQRLALARAMASRPRLLLLDEPLGPLDQDSRADLLDVLADVHERFSWTTLHVTHDPEEARAHASRTIALEAGPPSSAASE